MPNYHYYVNMIAQSTGEHEVHREGCSHPPSEENRKDLGLFNNCHAAVREAKEYYNNVDGCKYCSPECHTR